MKNKFTHVGDLLWLDASGEQCVSQRKLRKGFFVWVDEHGLMFSRLSGRSVQSAGLYLDISSIRPIG
ncbi:hypothetical protein [Plesiomonas shigelloides]|uniref:Uncharacterized protein n=1 Tax=Plesiomonas shigelloides 302-73 TaxID=1315976 RepID=R8ARG9_PLESH|nr:hypothetical protein [Plesiomonas shigelloides]EON88921.1 hypothetical protein PLESHI_08394 [Plesiomonas shigelloides 302-73]SUB64012.1 Uncharacterised protein [Plesiomonas shigelloides]